tara:strand:+ start:879 stop:1178 length:300 start_codon:yes stop_codon:yes gene_type:complete
MILGLDDIQKAEVNTLGSTQENSCHTESIAPRPNESPNQQVLRMWFNVLIEYKDGEARIIKSFSSPAKDSQVLKWKKSPTKKKVAASVKKVNIKDKEEY